MPEYVGYAKNKVVKGKKPKKGPGEKMPKMPKQAKKMPMKKKRMM